MKHDPEFILQRWKKMDKTNLNKEILSKFVHEHFLPAGTDAEEFSNFPDHKDEPAILSEIVDEKFRAWARDLNALWVKFGRKTIPDVSKNPDRYTLFEQKHPYLVPGGRFRECTLIPNSI